MDLTLYVMELKLSNNGGVLADVVALAVELDAQGKGLVGWKRVE